MKTAQEIRDAVARDRVVALQNFKAAWGTDSVESVMRALAQTIPGSTSPADAAVKARRILG